MASGFWKFGGFKLLDPAEILDAARRNGTTTEFWGRVNSFRCPRGREPGVGYLLMRGKDLSRTVNDASESANRKLINGQLNLNTSQKLEYFENGSSTAKLTIQKLYVTRALRMTRRPREDDEDGAYLVEVMDKRRILRMSVGISAAFPQSETQINSVGQQTAPRFSTTWQQAINTLWQKLPSSLRGTTPTLPYTPVGYPEELIHTSEPYWDFIHDLLEKIACTTVYDPIADTFRIVLIGDTQSGLDESLEGYAKRLIFDYDPISPENTNLPYRYNVFFPVRFAYQQFVNTNYMPVQHVSKLRTGGSSGSTLDTSVAIDDLTRSFIKSYGAESSFPLSNGTGDSTDPVTRANEIAARIEAASASLNNRMRRHYGGIITDILPGEQITEVAWRDYGDGSGPQTEILRTPLTETKPAGEQVAASAFRRPDNSPHLPWVPSPIAIVTVSGEPDENGLCTGGVVTVDPDNITSYTSFPGISPVWVRLPNRDNSGTSLEWGPLVAGGPVMAKFIGYYDPDPGGDDSDERPLYAVADFPKTFLGKVIDADAGEIEIYQLNQTTGVITSTSVTTNGVTGLNGDLGSTLHYSDGDVVVVQNVHGNRWFVTAVLGVNNFVGTLEEEAQVGSNLVDVDVSGEGTIEAKTDLLIGPLPQGTTVKIERIAGDWYITSPTQPAPEPIQYVGWVTSPTGPPDLGGSTVTVQIGADPDLPPEFSIEASRHFLKSPIPAMMRLCVQRLNGVWYITAPTYVP